MSDLDNIVQALSHAAANSSGRERKLYNTLQDAIAQQSYSKLQHAKELYQGLGYSSQSRADTLFEYVSEYLS